MSSRLLGRLKGLASLRPRRFDTYIFRLLFRRPAFLVGVGAFEAADLLSNRVEPKVKYLATLKTSSLIGCPF